MTRAKNAENAAAPFAIVGAAAALLLALGGCALAWSTDFVGCLDRDICEDRDLLRFQLALAIVNVAVAVVLLIFVLRRMRTASLIAAFAFAVGFAIWALLNDAATHGWDNLRLLPG